MRRESEVEPEDQGGDAGGSTSAHIPHLQSFKSMLNVASGRYVEKGNTITSLDFFFLTTQNLEERPLYA